MEEFVQQRQLHMGREDGGNNDKTYLPLRLGLYKFMFARGGKRDVPTWQAGMLVGPWLGRIPNRVMGGKEAGQNFLDILRKDKRRFDTTSISLSLSIKDVWIKAELSKREFLVALVASPDWLGRSCVSVQAGHVARQQWW